MGLFIAALILSFVFTVNANSSDIIIMEKCLKENGITHAEYMEAASHSAKDADMKVKCASMCMMKGHNLITEDGTFNVEKTVKEFGRDRSHAGSDREHIPRSVIEACAKDNLNDCDSAFNLLQCINEKLEAYYSKQ